MSKFEERAFQIGKVKADLAGLKNQLSRLKEDLGQFMARKPDGAVIAPLRERIKELEAEIAESEQRARDAKSAAAAEAADRTSGNSTGLYPPRRR